MDLPDLIRYPRWGAEEGTRDIYNSQPASATFMSGDGGANRHGELLRNRPDNLNPVVPGKPGTRGARTGTHDTCNSQPNDNPMVCRPAPNYIHPLTWP